MQPAKISWLVGFFLAAGSAAVLMRSAVWKELAPLVALLVIASFGLIAEVTRALRRETSEEPQRFRLADGNVEVLPMAGVEAESTAGLPGFLRFVRLIEPSRPTQHVRKVVARRPKLLGQVALISMFVGRDGSDWTDEEIAQAYKALESAGSWVEHEAIRHGAPVNFGLAQVFFRTLDEEDEAVEIAFVGEGDEFGPMEAHASTKAVTVASRAASRLGFDDFVDMVDRVNDLVEAEVRVWFFHVRRAGRSFAIDPEHSVIPGVGLAFCYAKESSFPEPLVGPARVNPTTVAHEVLHLFGASDKYGVLLRSFPRDSVTSRDVMRLSHARLSRMAIDPLTALEIGWTPDAGKKNAPREPG